MVSSSLWPGVHHSLSLDGSLTYSDSWGTMLKEQWAQDLALPLISHWVSFQFLLSRCPAVHPGHASYPFFHNAPDRMWVPSAFFTHKGSFMAGQPHRTFYSAGPFLSMLCSVLALDTWLSNTFNDQEITSYSTINHFDLNSQVWLLTTWLKNKDS